MLKYIKVFEEFNKSLFKDSDYFTELPFVQYIDSRNRNVKKRMPFTNKEINTIKEEFTEIEIHITLSEMIEIKLDYIDRLTRVIIHKFDDEWFYIHNTIDEKYYECDGLDGLIICLKTILSK